MDLGIDGKVAFVAASTAGLGLASARRLAAEGARVAITGRRGDLAASLASDIDGAIGLAMDVTEPASVDAALAATEDRLGSIDILVLNSGGPPPGGPLDVSVADHERAAALLLHPHQRMIAATIEHMRSQQWGRVVAVGSTAIAEPSRQLVLSSTHRAALAAYLKALAGTVAADGVTVNMVHPGRVATERLEQLDAAAARRRGITVDEVRAASLARIPIGRAGDPDEFGAVVAFLCSVPAAYVTGVQIRVDGGVVSGW